MHDCQDVRRPDKFGLSAACFVLYCNQCTCVCVNFVPVSNMGRYQTASFASNLDVIFDYANLADTAFRLRQAHKCSQISSRPAYARPSEVEAGGGDVAVQDDEAAKRIHGQFMQMAMQLIDGRMDSSQYEDSCRQLLGTDCNHCVLMCILSFRG